MRPENRATEAHAVSIGDADSTEVRRPYVQPRLLDFGSLTELTAGGNFTGPDPFGQPNVNQF